MSAVAVRRLVPLLAVAGALAPLAARAGNGLHPRTPVEWPDDVPCMTVIDRGQSPVYQFSYGIPYEDTDVTPDEVADSRRHQFIAVCRDHSPQEPLPTWLSWKDIDAAANKGLIDPMDVVDDDVFETNPLFKDCFARILEDDARRPITFAEAMKPVVWDTTGLPAGPYVVQGYTWEPAFNIWTHRAGVVHVVDGPDLSAVAPAAALMNPEDFMFGGDTLTLQGCVRAMPGATMSLYWSLTSDAQLNWLPYVEGVAVDGDVIALPFQPPEDAIQETIALRLDVTDPMQRTFSTYPLHLLTVLPGQTGTTGCGDSGSFIGNESCGEVSTGDGGTGVTTSGGSVTGGEASTSGGPSSSSDSQSTGPMINPVAPDGCACDTGDTGTPWALGGLLLPGLGRRRQKRGSTLPAP